MNYFVLFEALFFGIVSLAVIFYIAKVFIEALAGNTTGWTERMRFKRKERLLPALDALIEKENWGAALDLIRNSFHFDCIAADPDLIDKVNSHHLGVLSRMVIVAEQKAKHLPNLAIIEDLLISRSDLMRGYIDVLKSKNSLKKRQKKTPSWAVDEYDKRLDDFIDKLRTNRRSLESQLEKAFLAFSYSEVANEITYH